MLKGVSQKVIEVVHTDNRYFEKAILFLRPNVQGEDRADLNAQAGEYLGQLHYQPQKSARKKCSWMDLVKFTGAALLGAGAACAFFLL